MTRVPRPPTPEEFNPYDSASIHIPLAVLRYEGLSWGAKCLYGRLVLFRGRKAEGFCAPSREVMAAELNATTAAVDHWLKELVDQGFIARTRRRGSSRCKFLAHPCFSDFAKLRNVDASRVRNSANMTSQICEVDFANLRNAYKEEKTFNKTITDNGSQRSDKDLNSSIPAYAPPVNLATLQKQAADRQRRKHEGDRLRERDQGQPTLTADAVGATAEMNDLPEVQYANAS